jgi:hypothetical protein
VIYEVTFLAHTGLPPERIQASSYSVDDSTSPPTHRFKVRGRGPLQPARPIDRVDVLDVREVPPESALPPRQQQVSNRVFPSGK